jgi:hypothetical protein
MIALDSPLRVESGGDLHARAGLGLFPGEGVSSGRSRKRARTVSATGDETSGSTAGEGRSGAGRPDNTRALVVGLIVVACGLTAAIVVSALAALIAALLHVGPVGVFTIGGSTFAACLTLEIGLAGLYAAFWHRPL